MKSWKLRGECTLEDVGAGMLDWQKQFLGSPARAVAAVGGQGSGKSVILCTCAIMNSIRDPLGFSLIGRLNYPALEGSTMKTFLELVPEDFGEWKPTPKEFHYFNGHVTTFKHLDITDPKVAGHIKSMNLSAAYIDEGTEIAEDTYWLITGRVRRKTAPRHLIRITSNPAGQDWVWRHFFDPLRRDAFQRNVGINMDTQANYHLPADVVADWEAMYPEDWKARYLRGQFADFSDLIYKDFKPATHTWSPLGRHSVFGGLGDPPPEWPVIVGIDVGGGEEGDPWACVAIAVAPDGRLYQFGEVYGPNLKIWQIAEELQALVHGRKLDGLAYDTAQAVAARELEEYDLGGSPADKAVKAGLFKATQYIHSDERLAHPFGAQVRGSPRYFISEACVNTIRELTAYKWAKDRSGNPKFEPAHEHSHCPDAIRYAIHTFRPLPQRPRDPELWENPAITEFSRLYWHDCAKHAREEPEPLALTRFRRPVKNMWKRSAIANKPNSIRI